MKHLICDLYGDDCERFENPFLAVPLTAEFRDAVARALGLFRWVAGREAAVARIDVALEGVRAFERSGDLPEALSEESYSSPTVVALAADALGGVAGREVVLATFAVTGGDRVSGEFLVVVRDDRDDEVRLWAGPVTMEDVAAWTTRDAEKAATEVAESEES